MSYAIEVEHVKKKFNDIVALEDVSFSVKKGEIFGFLGPSGAGKTTMIKILTAQLTMNFGHASIFGMPAKNMSQSVNKKRFGILTDNSGLYKRLTVEENLALYQKLYDLPSSAIDEALLFVNLTSARKKKVSTLSKGMIQRVTLARAIMHKPELLFLDEPTSSLDPINTQHIYKGLRKLNEMRTTIFLTTHDMYEAETLCDRVAFLHEGKIQEVGAPMDLKLKYRSETMSVELKNGEKYTLPLNANSSIDRLKDWFQQQLVQRIETNEPSLGDIFMRLTGSELV